MKNLTKTGSEVEGKGTLGGGRFAGISAGFLGLSRLLGWGVKLGMPGRVRMGFRSLVLGLVGLVLLGWQAVATPLPRHGLFVYSSLCRDLMTDDLTGDRLVLVRLPLHDFGYVERGEGSISTTPMLDLKITQGRIAFRYQDESEMDPAKSLKSVQSAISAESVGLVSWNGTPFRLARQWALESEIPRCKQK